ncbi:MAG: DNA repair protein RecN [Firmicutes bacterium]|nr:DNA repair protein RecN [Bacillota bacterium]
MLENLRVQNVVLIGEAELRFREGLNILSGETGAGKSIIIDALKFALGGRAGKDFLRAGEQVASVDALFRVREGKNAEALRLAGVGPDEDGSVLLSRTLNSQGKSFCRINGKPAATGMLRAAAGSLIDIHGQHENMSLFDSGRHLDILDMFRADGAAGVKNDLEEAYARFHGVMKEIKTLTAVAADGDAKLENLNFQIEELKSVRLMPKEEEALIRRRDALRHSGRIYADAVEALALLRGGGDGEDSAESRVSRAASVWKGVAGLDGSQEELAGQFLELAGRLSEITGEIERYAGGLEEDPAALDRIEARLDLIARVRRKYGGDAESALKRLDKLERESEAIVSAAERLGRLGPERKKRAVALIKLSSELSDERKAAADGLRTKVEAVLRELGMKNARFEIKMDKKKAFSPNGFDTAEFLISPNQGEEPKPLSKIASGGEVSRVMLAIKTALADVDLTEAFVFDEIDAGVSGRTAQKVAEKLRFLAGKHQIICITHLPQIAAMADAHFLIEKKSDGARTTTSVSELDAERSVMELARLIGGARITEATVKAAKELKEMAIS